MRWSVVSPPGPVECPTEVVAAVSSESFMRDIRVASSEILGWCAAPQYSGSVEGGCDAAAVDGDSVTPDCCLSQAATCREEIRY